MKQKKKREGKVRTEGGGAAGGCGEGKPLSPRKEKNKKDKSRRQLGHGK